MTVRHLPPDATAEAVATVIAEDGCAVIDDLASPELLDRLDAEMRGYVDHTPYGVDEFAGPRTRRTGGLVARSEAARALVLDDLVLGTCDRVLDHVQQYQLHLTQLIRIEPGGVAQMIHRDQWAFDFFTFPTGYQVQCNTIWAATDFTEANGATRVIPGSHRLEDRRQFEVEDTEPAEMAAGSCLFYTGALYHGAGANVSDGVRYGLNVTYAVSWLRQEENQYLSCPFEIARALPDDLLKLMGYARGAYALGYVDDLRDPLDALRGRSEGLTGLGDLDAAQEKIRA